MKTTLNWTALLAGAVAAFVGASVVLVGVLIIETTIGIPSDSNVFFPLYLAVLLSMAYGGYVAARSAPETPLLHGALAPVPAYVVILIVAVAIKLARGTSWNTPNLIVVEIFNLFMSMTAGMLGGRLAHRRLSRR
ncbi:MAG: hypothetical protein JWP02_3967 [Acidimicrobiales bacterium]|nr:hypothetical protein [Acidimicrobiales bacterium]